MKRSACVVAGKVLPVRESVLSTRTRSSRLVKAVVDPIVADLQAERVFHLAAKPLAENRVACIQSSHPAPVLLFELVAVIGVRQVVSEVRKQIEIVIKPVGRDFRCGICAPDDAIQPAEL